MTYLSEADLESALLTQLAEPRRLGLRPEDQNKANK